MVKLTIDENRCKGCGLCVRACPKKLLELAKQKLNENWDHPEQLSAPYACVACASCARTCPDAVITIEKE